MVSARTTRSAVVGTLLAAALGLSGLTSAVAADRSVHGGEVDPGRMANGMDLRLPWLNGSTDRIVQPGHRSLRWTGSDPSTVLLNARGGYVLPTTLAGGRHHHLSFVKSSGGDREFVHDTALLPRLTSTDGRRAVLAGQPDRAGRTTVRVVRIGDGRTVGIHAFPRGSQVMAAGPKRVLVQRVTPGHSDTVWWDPARDTVRAVDRRTPTGAPLSTIPPAASVGAHRAAARSGKHDLVVDLRTGRHLWKTTDGEYALSFSPDDKRVVTASGLEGFNQEAPWEMARKLRVRDARTGKLLAFFTGHFGVTGAGIAPVWETPRTLLLHATSDWVADPEGEGSYPNSSIVRCSTVSGNCGRIEHPWSSTFLLLRKSN